MKTKDTTTQHKATDRHFSDNANSSTTLHITYKNKSYSVKGLILPFLKKRIHQIWRELSY